MLVPILVKQIWTIPLNLTVGRRSGPHNLHVSCAVP